jgi:hypothetical protein
MKAVLRALAGALPLVFAPRVLGLVLLPLVAGLAAAGALALVFWKPLAAVVAVVLVRGYGALGLPGDADAVAAAGGGVVAALVFVGAAGALALAALATFAGPVFVRVVAARHHPALERRRGGTFAGGLANTLATLALWLPAWLVTLPLLLFPPLGVPASLLLNAWLNQRLFRYDALAEHASADERAAVVARAGRRLFGLGLVLAPLSLVPFVNLVAPLYAGLAFTQLCLDELARLRGEADTGDPR